MSNGRHVVRSDAEGFYALPAPASGHVFVVKPAGFSLPLVSRLSQPRHFRDTGVGNVDFLLVPAPVARSFNAVLMADPQPENHRHLDFIRDSVTPVIAGSNASFALTLGDIVGDDLSLLDRYRSIMGAADLPLWHAGGNHDLDFSAQDGVAARAPFRRAFGPATYAFEEGEALFVVLDNVEYGGPGGGYRGMIGESQLAFLRNLLAHVPCEKLVVLGMHIPLRTGWNPQSARDNTADAQELLSILDGRRAVSFCGHMHATEHQYLPLGRGHVEHHHQSLAAISGSWWSGPYDHRGRPLALGVDGCPPGFHMLEIDGTQYATRFVPLAPQESQWRTVLARCTPCRDTGANVIDGAVAKSDAPCEVAVNVFDGGPRTRVRLRMPGGEWQSMQRVRKPDPFMLDHFAKAGGVRHDWVKAETCEHLWTTPLQAHEPGLHRAQIEVTSEFGHTMRDFKVVELA